MTKTLRSASAKGVLITGANGRITRMNPVAVSLTGRRWMDALGRPVDLVLRLINEETREPAIVPVEEALRTGEIRRSANHSVLISRDGSEHSIADSAAPVRDENGTVRGALLCCGT